MRTGICILLATAFVAFELPLSGAQAPIRGVVTNVRATASGGTVEILYDLAAPQAGLAFDVTIEASEDGGSSFPITLSSVTGDVGAGVIPGVAKRVVWNAARDVERAAFDRFQYRVTATAISRAAAPARKPSGGGAASTAAPSGGGGGKTKWILIAGGAAAAGGALALSRSSEPPAPAISDASLEGATDVLLASANAVTFNVSVAGAEGAQVSWSFGDGTSASGTIANGAASTRKTYATAGSFTPRVTVSRAGGGSTSRDYRLLTVTTITGRWIGRFTTITGTFTMNLTQNGTAITGDATDDFTRDTGRAAGNVAGPPSAMRFRLNYPDNTFWEIDVTGSGDQRTFTGTITGRNQNPFTMTKQ